MKTVFFGGGGGGRGVTFGPNEQKLGLKLGFLPFSQVWWE